MIRDLRFSLDAEDYAVYAQAFVRKLLVMVMDVTAQPPHKDSLAIDGDGDGDGNALYTY